MVTVILLALNTSVDSVISVIFISDDTFAASPTITNDATFISVILAGATTYYRKEESEGTGEEGGGEGAGEEGAYGLTCVNANTKVSTRLRVLWKVM